MQNKIDRLLKNYSNARRSWEAWCFMVNFNLARKNVETSQYISTNKLLSHLRYVVLKDFHIEMYKILKRSKRNTDNIFILLEEYEPASKFKKRQVDFCLKKLDEYQFIISNLCDVRDKYYAHLDKDYEEYLSIGISLKEILECFKIIERSIITLTSLTILKSYLETIPSRDELSL